MTIKNYFASKNMSNAKTNFFEVFFDLAGLRK